MDAPSPYDSTSRLGDSRGLRQQRDWALGYLGLSLAISLAVLQSNLGPHPTPWIDLQPQIENGRRMLAESFALLETNRQVLRDNRVALENVRKAVAGSKP